MSELSLSGVTPETMLLTSKGYEPIGTLRDQNIQIWNGEEFEKTKVIRVAQDQPIVQLKTQNTLELECTPDHKFYVQPGLMPNKLYIAQAQELEYDIKLPRIPATPICDGGDEIFPHAYSHGFYVGVEKYHRSRLKTSRAPIFGARRPLLEKLDLDREATTNLSLYFTESLPADFEVPLSPKYSVETKLEWLAGVFDGGLHKRKAKPLPIWHLYSDNVDFLYQVKLLLQTLGVDSRHVKNEDPKYLHYSLRVRGKAMETLRDLGIPTRIIKFEDVHVKPNGPNGTLPTRILSVEDAYRTSDVYNFAGTNKKTAVFNGILTTSN